MGFKFRDITSFQINLVVLYTLTKYKFDIPSFPFNIFTNYDKDVLLCK